MAMETNAGSYPVYFAATADNKVANWRPLAHWAMAIPHFFVGYVLGLVGGVCTIISWFAIVITGKMPEGLANLIIMSNRYTMRTQTFFLGMTEQYPPFEFDTTAADPGNYAIRLDFTPELEGRNRLTVAFRIFMLIPVLIFWYVVNIGAGIVALIAWFAVLFTGTYPEGMRNFVLKVFRLTARMQAYGGLLTDQYPPFALD